MPLSNTSLGSNLRVVSPFRALGAFVTRPLSNTNRNIDDRPDRLKLGNVTTNDLIIEVSRVLRVNRDNHCIGQRFGWPKIPAFEPRIVMDVESGIT